MTWNFTWANGRHLTSATTSGSTYTYTYTADGTRTGKTVGDVEHVYYYADGKLRREQRDGTNIDFFYDASGAPYAFRYQGDYYYYVTNLQDDVVRIVESDGTVVATYKYDAWGNVLSSTGAMASVNPLRYRGYYYDSETGFYYLMSRYYDPEIGRFINADALASTGQDIIGFNMFAYCLNNPEGYFDPGGNMAGDLTANGGRGFSSGNTGAGYGGGAPIPIGIPIGIGSDIGRIVDQLWDTISQSYARSKNRGYRYDNEVHHLVAKEAWNARPASAILNETLTGGVESPLNKITIKTGLHRRLHTKVYYGIANAIVIGAYYAGDDAESKQQNVVISLSVLWVIVNQLNAMSPY